MRGESALAHALDLARTPALSPHLKHRPLPPDVLTVIRIASGCEETTTAAVAQSGDDPIFIKRAAERYLQQVVCVSGAGPYRLLGLHHQATRAEIRTHMLYMMKVLQPDHPQSDWHRACTLQVVEAWRQLNGHPGKAPAISRSRPVRPRPPRGYRPPWVPQPVAKPRPPVFLTRRHCQSLGLLVLFAGLVLPDGRSAARTNLGCAMPASSSAGMTGSRKGADIELHGPRAECPA